MNDTQTESIQTESIQTDDTQTDDTQTDDTQTESKIKHIVISGGGPAGFIYYGALRETHKRQIWSLDTIESVHGVSIGGILSVILLLGYDWPTLDDYFIKRPWEQLLNITPDQVFAAFAQKGVFGEKFFKNILDPLFAAKDLSIDVTLQEFFEITGKNLVLYSHNINDVDFNLSAFSHTTHPKMRLLTAVHMTCAIPVAFTPVFHEGGCYIDGGVVANIPVNNSIKVVYGDGSVDTDSFLVLRNLPRENFGSETTSPEISTFLTYMNHIIFKLVRFVNRDKEQIVVPNTIWCDVSKVGRMHEWLETISSKKARRRLIRTGVDTVNRFCRTQQNR